MALSNISVALADIQKYQPDISEYLFSGQSITDVINIVKRNLERDIQIKSDLDDDELSKIKDGTQKYLYDRIIQQCISHVYLANGMLDKASVHSRLAEGIPMRYYMDEDSDGVEDDGESENLKSAFFGR